MEQPTQSKINHKLTPFQVDSIITNSGSAREILEALNRAIYKFSNETHIMGTTTFFEADVMTIDEGVRLDRDSIYEMITGQSSAEKLKGIFRVIGQKITKEGYVPTQDEVIFAGLVLTMLEARLTADAKEAQKRQQKK